MPQKKLCVNYSKISLRNSNQLVREVKRESKELFPNFYTTRIDMCFLLTSTSLCCQFLNHVMKFQGDSPLIHKVYYQQVNLVKKFYSYFVKPSVVAKCKKGKHLLKLDLNDENILPEKLLFIGVKAKKTCR